MGSFHTNRSRWIRLILALSLLHGTVVPNDRAEEVRSVGLFSFYSKLRPKLPFAPKSSLSLTREQRVKNRPLRIVKGAMSAATAAAVAATTGTHAPEAIIAFSLWQSTLPMATHATNHELQDWYVDKNFLFAGGEIDHGRFARLRRFVKGFGMSVIMTSFLQTGAGLFGLRPLEFDPLAVGTIAVTSTLISNNWYSVLGKYIPKGSLWNARIPVIMFGVANVGTIAAILNGPMNLITIASYGGLGISGYLTEDVLDYRHGSPSLTKRVLSIAEHAYQSSPVRAVRATCAKIFGTLR